MKLILLTTTSAVIALGSYSLGLRWNCTPSMARGVWRVTTFNHAVRGENVVLCLPEAAGRMGLARGYLDAGNCPGGTERLIKTLAAVPGDRVVVSADGITINGTAVPDSKPLPRDDLGRQLTAADQGLYVLGDNEGWVIGGNDLRSYDSRYFGPINLTGIQGLAAPVFTAGK
jgi:conjugative transfer signal peptidase TraF